METCRMDDRPIVCRHAGLWSSAAHHGLATIEVLGTRQSAEGRRDIPVAQRLASGIAEGRWDRGILVCGTGVGMAIAANKVAGCRAALAWSAETAQLAREHNNAQVIGVGARMHTAEEARAAVDELHAARD